MSSEIISLQSAEEKWGYYHGTMRQELFNAIWDGFGAMYDFDEEAGVYIIKEEFSSFDKENLDLVLKGLFDNSWKNVR